MYRLYSGLENQRPNFRSYSVRFILSVGRNFILVLLFLYVWY
ncbi:hypothetical protein HMPREF3191_01219 [Veillonellaceae bacterium DNF00626]|nr:hypothetical protein HMPREF3191_01219 [Veillonellaceae bacterium DNF00626]